LEEDPEPSTPPEQSSSGTRGAYNNATLSIPLPSGPTPSFPEASRTTQTKVLYFEEGARYDFNNRITGKPAWTCLGPPQKAVLTCEFDEDNRIIDYLSYITIAGIDTSKNQDGSTNQRTSIEGRSYDLNLKSIGNQRRYMKEEEGKETELAAIFWGGPTFSGAQTIPKTIIAEGAIILEDMRHTFDVEAIGPWGEQVPGGWYGRESLLSER
jgi:hypothetical protein